MHIAQIGRDIGSGDLGAVERAYRAIVAYPNEEPIDGADPSSLYAALEEVCGALTDDVDVLPNKTCGAADVRPGSTYAEGAADFREHRAHWMHRFQSVMAGF